MTVKLHKMLSTGPGTEKKARDSIVLTYRHCLMTTILIVILRAHERMLLTFGGFLSQLSSASVPVALPAPGHPLVCV